MLREDLQNDGFGSSAESAGTHHRGTTENLPAEGVPGTRLPAFQHQHSLANWSPSRRPPRHPVKRVPRRHLMADHLNGTRDPADWVLIGIEAANDLGTVRTGMTYNKEYGTSAGFFEKPRRLQFFEGPNEPAVADHLEMCPRYLDFQFQPLRLTFQRADGRIVHKYPDVGIEYEDHSVRFGEIKSNDAWFQAEGIRRPLDRIDQAMASAGLDPLLKIKGAAFRVDEVLKVHGIAMEARLTRFDPEIDGRAARVAISAAGGKARYSDVVAALGGSRAHAADKLYAMLLRRLVDFDLSIEPTSDTVVTVPRPASAFALRELLARFQRQVA